MSESEKYSSIKNWAENDRPREKLLILGPNALSDSELLAIIIHSGSKNESAVDLSRRILSDSDNDLSTLSKKSVEQLMTFRGIGQAKAITIAAAMELVNRKKFSSSDTRQILSSKDVYEEIYHTLVDKHIEEFWLLILNSKNKIKSKTKISTGGTNATIVDVKFVMKKAVESLAISIIVVHNHPSENPNPSDADINLTNKIKNACHFFDIKFLDHIIFAGNNYYSFADEGKL
ncbi:MAG: DNA repair protein RadC [Saprospiraceae bacterium]